MSQIHVVKKRNDESVDGVWLECLCGDTALVTTANEERKFRSEHGGLKDSGERESEPTGALREPSTGRGAYELITPEGLKRLAIIYEKGSKKYSPRNWEKGGSWGRLYQSAMRHMNMWMEGATDEDHLAHAAWNLFALMHFEKYYVEGNDIPFRKIPAPVITSVKDSSGFNITETASGWLTECSYCLIKVMQPTWEVAKESVKEHIIVTHFKNAWLESYTSSGYKFNCISCGERFQVENPDNKYEYMINHLMDAYECFEKAKRLAVHTEELP
jgi:hypothetical protein